MGADEFEQVELGGKLFRSEGKFETVLNLHFKITRPEYLRLGLGKRERMRGRKGKEEENEHQAEGRRRRKKRRRRW